MKPFDTKDRVVQSPWHIIQWTSQLFASIGNIQQKSRLKRSSSIISCIPPTPDYQWRIGSPYLLRETMTWPLWGIMWLSSLYKFFLGGNAEVDAVQCRWEDWSKVCNTCCWSRLRQKQGRVFPVTHHYPSNFQEALRLYLQLHHTPIQRVGRMKSRRMAIILWIISHNGSHWVLFFFFAGHCKKNVKFCTFHAPFLFVRLHNFGHYIT